jgi:hypothetical protein
MDSWIECLILKIYFDKDHSENHVMIREKNKWFRKHFKNQCHDMMLQARSTLLKCYMIKCMGQTDHTVIKYIYNLGKPETEIYRNASLKVKALITNSKYDKKLC